MKIRYSVLSTITLVILWQSVQFCGLSYGWGGYGHRVIAAIAEWCLRSETQSKIIAIVGESNSLESVSNWASDMEREKRKTSKWHYIYLPKNRDDYIPERDCPRGGCLISSIEDFAEVLANDSAPLEKREEALKYVVHFIGDLHQPFHCGYREDSGGYDTKVIFARRKTNLHKVWDTDLLARDQMKFEDYVQKLFKRASPDDIKKMQESTILEWMSESRSILRNHAYTYPSSGILDFAYQDHSLGIIDNQLLKAGVRLAGFLDAVLGDESSEKTFSK